MIANFEDKTAYAQCIIGYMDRSLKEPKVFVGRTNVQLFFLSKIRNIIRREKLSCLEDQILSAGIQFSSQMVLLKRNKFIYFRTYYWD